MEKLYNNRRDEKIEEARKEAGERNEHRNIFGKILNKDKTAAMDVMHEEALKDNIDYDEKKSKENNEIRERVKDRKIEVAAKEIYQKRMSGQISYAFVDDLLAKNGLKPNTPAADDFMREWDKKEAQNSVYEKSSQASLVEMTSLRMKSVRSESNYKKEFSNEIRQNLKKTIDQSQNLIVVGDSVNLKMDKGSVLYSVAEKRKEYFISNLITNDNLSRIQAEKVYETELSKKEYGESKKEYGERLVAEKREELEQRIKYGENLDIDFEMSKFNKKVLFEELIINENKNRIEAEKVEMGSKENSIFTKFLEKYNKLGRFGKLAVGTSLATGIYLVAAPVGVAVSASSVAIFAGSRFIKGIMSLGGGALAAKGIGIGVDKIYGNKFGNKLEAEEKTMRGDFLLQNLNESEKNFNEYFEKKGKYEKRKQYAKVGAMIVGGFGTGVAISMIDASQIFNTGEAYGSDKLNPINKEINHPIETPNSGNKEIASAVEKISVDKTEGLKSFEFEIENRGPEGVLIDRFKSDTNFSAAMEKLGWTSDNVGAKAHLVWLEHAKEALKNPEIKVKMENLGYSHDIEGYGRMMRRIGKGIIDIDPKTGKIDLEKMNYLKAIGSDNSEIDLEKHFDKALDDIRGQRVISEGRSEAEFDKVIADLAEKNRTSANGEIGERVVNQINPEAIVSDSKPLSNDSILNQPETAQPRVVNQINPESIVSDNKPFENIKINTSEAMSFSELPQGKSTYLDFLVKDGRTVSLKSAEIIGQLRNGNLTSNDLINFMAQKVGRNNLSGEYVNSWKKTFDSVQFGDDRDAKKAIDIYLNYLQSLK